MLKSRSADDCENVQDINGRPSISNGPGVNASRELQSLCNARLQQLLTAAGRPVERSLNPQRPLGDDLRGRGGSPGRGRPRGGGGSGRGRV